MHRSHNYRNLDLLRTLAVLWVFICHVGLMLNIGPLAIKIANGLGRFGVILFFFHTSFVLAQSMEGLRISSSRWVPKFYLRRAFRIYPLAVFVILLAVLSGVPFAPWDPTWAPSLGLATIAANLLLVQNLVAQPSVIVPLWSLPIEVQMYVVLPALFLLANHRNWRLRLGICLAASVTVIAVVYQTTGHLNVLGFVPCFFSGIIAYRFTKEREPNWPASTWALAILVSSIAGIFSNSINPAEWALCFLVAWIFPRVLDMPKSWFSKLCYKVAQYSYGIYLTHLFALWISFTLLRPWLASPVLQIGATALLTATFSIVLFHLVENPFIRLGKRLSVYLDDKQPAEKLLAVSATSDR